jgi:predicted RNA-binding Zn ribbon-like protein
VVLAGRTAQCWTSSTPGGAVDEGRAGARHTSDLVGLTQAELIAQRPPVTPSLLLAAHELSEVTVASVQAHLRARAAPRPAIAVIDRWLPGSAAPGDLALDDLGTRRSDGPPRRARPSRHGAHRYDAAEMLGAEQRGRLRVCASDTCSARFYDRSRSRRRASAPCRAAECSQGTGIAPGPQRPRTTVHVESLERSQPARGGERGRVAKWAHSASGSLGSVSFDSVSGARQRSLTRDDEFCCFRRS